ncbi:hypothetical protein GMRT_10239 [Giardia muris]|uniref:Coiled-coil domain-containing protein 167 n=1 Tax=Giardia muris TaxID=5742 RepID=A0A4Z1T188_GIAMU|nr:hypothetical protein GMRT_10239 [Giardia muris]|eukprot:TNJ29468.1 hypothetical protein GMRT_10239 [Giardia muris]
MEPVPPTNLKNLQADVRMAQNELELLQFSVRRLEECRREREEQLVRLQSYYHSLKQERALRLTALKERQYPVLWLCTGLSVGLLFLIARAIYNEV